jgi:hypothetical protein
VLFAGAYEHARVFVDADCGANNRHNSLMNSLTLIDYWQSIGRARWSEVSAFARRQNRE